MGAHTVIDTQRIYLFGIFNFAALARPLTTWSTSSLADKRSAGCRWGCAATSAAPPAVKVS